MKDMILTAHNVDKYFNEYHVIKNLSLVISRGEVFGFIGKNGAGKTTFMRIVCGLMRPSSGFVELSHKNTNTEMTNRPRNKIGFLPQNVRFHDKQNAYEVMRFFTDLKDVDVKASIKFASELEIDMKKGVRSLSPGQQRKLQLVIAAMGLPELLVLDEPTAGLDPMGVQQVREIIKMLKRKGCSIFISSHALLELDNTCNCIAVIEKGEILYQGPFHMVYEIEIQEPADNLLQPILADKRVTYDIKRQKLYANIERNEVPQLLCFLYTKGISVFDVKPQGLEAFYNSIIKGGA